MPKKKAPRSAAWADPDDAPLLVESMLAEAEVFDGDNFVRRARGRPKSPAAKTQISLRLDPDVLAALRAQGPGWQAHVNTLLRQSLGLTRPIAPKAA